jgi:hypothetical protein
MCNHCTENPRDTLHDGAMALAGLRDLVGDIARTGKQFDQVRPHELSVLLRIVSDKIDDANLRLQDYVPRGPSSVA